MPKDRESDEIVYLRNENRRLRKSLNVLTAPLNVLLKRRGFKIFRQNPKEDLLLPPDEFLDDYYRMLYRYSFRLFLRDVIKHQDFFRLEQVTRYATADVTADYLRYILSVRIVTETEAVIALLESLSRVSANTGMVCGRDIQKGILFRIHLGVKFKRPRIGGDYDVLGKFDGSILYIEVKSSPPRQVQAGEISAFFDRIFDLVPEVAVFFMDTELRMKDKIVPMFEAELSKDLLCLLWSQGWRKNSFR
jgi:hypothetical protein